MKWLLVSRQHEASHGGIGTYVQRFCNAARGGGWHVELVTQPGEAWPACARVHEIRPRDLSPAFQSWLPELRRRHTVRPYRYALWSIAVAERLLRLPGDFDVIEFVDCQAEGFAALECPEVRERHRRTAFIVHAHTPMYVEESINGSDESEFGRATYHDWERRALAMADGVVVTSRVLADALGENVRATVIPYPIADDAAPHQGERAQRIALIGSVQARKGVDTWARGLNEVLRARPKVNAMLVGPDTATAPDGLSMAAHVQRMIDPRFIDRFQWAGSLPHGRVRELIARSSLVVTPSRLESFSFVAAEALLAGTPAIVSDRTGIAEHVPSLRRVRSEDSAAWAHAQIDALSDAASALANAAQGRGEMLASCRPECVLAARMNMAEACAPDPKGGYRTATNGDSLAEMSAFVAAVDETLESAAEVPAAISSARS